MCDSVFKRLHAKGIGTETKSTPVLSNHEEGKLWESGVIGLDTLIGLLKAVFCYNGKNFSLHGQEEHHSLRISQFKRETTVVNGNTFSSYVYEEFGSKK